MAELIDKGALVSLVNREKEMSSSEYSVGYIDAINDVNNMIDVLPTTTEADIRAMAIDEFVKEIRDWQKEVYTNDRYAGELDFLFKHIYEIAEQLKEE